MSVRKIRLALIGAGLAGAPHAMALKMLRDEAEVVCVTGRTPARIGRFAHEHGLPLCESVAEVIGNPQIDAVLILTPPATHLELVEQCAAAGKHVLLEKPLDISTQRASRVVETCDAHGVQLGVVFQNRFRPAARRLAQRVQEGAVGPLAHAAMELRWWRPQSYYDQPGRGTCARDGGGVLLTQAIHTLDILLWLAGDVAAVTGTTATTALHSMETEDIASALLTFESGATGRVFATTAAYPGFAERIELIGSKATTVLEGGRLDVFYHDGNTEHFDDGTTSGFGANPMDFSPAAHCDLLRDFIGAVRDGCAPLITGRDGLRVQRLIERIVGSRGERI
ncbi:Gfo/Idh/MocA family oxidoreductase [Paraburkholderia sp. JPY432]|uniref:Gfo/Idh/MocA family protein n=1 Tax=Paraburkholderia youngii TaxID=2782701 RepID=UPI0015954479|nr:Gfo/Idh/MocA family oxidoreductase [Paraburkholderia youngii]NVH74105.1 Gfo/Idh/MocA family oxidoreductase [Paraburkholderia youngii]